MNGIVLHSGPVGSCLVLWHNGILCHDLDDCFVGSKTSLLKCCHLLMLTTCGQYIAAAGSFVKTKTAHHCTYLM